MRKKKELWEDFPWDAIHVESFERALVRNDLPGYFARQEKCARRLLAHLRRVRKRAQKKR
jgi:hypothetical protein